MIHDGQSLCDVIPSPLLLFSPLTRHLCPPTCTADAKTPSLFFFDSTTRDPVLVSWSVHPSIFRFFFLSTDLTISLTTLSVYISNIAKRVASKTGNFFHAHHPQQTASSCIALNTICYITKIYVHYYFTEVKFFTSEYRYYTICFN